MLSLPAMAYVDDNWSFLADNDSSGDLSVGDTVTNANDSIDPSGVTATYGVNGFGNVTSGLYTGSLPGSATINDAITGTASGTVNVLEGTYQEQVTIDKSLTFNGAQAGADARGRDAVAETIITPSTGNVAVITVQAPDVTVDGFTVLGGSNAGITGIYVSDQVTYNELSGVVIEDNIVRDFDLADSEGGGIIVGPLTDGVEIAYNDIRDFTLSSNRSVVGIGAHGNPGEEARNANIHDNFVHGLVFDHFVSYESNFRHPDIAP